MSSKGSLAILSELYEILKLLAIIGDVAQVTSYNISEMICIGGHILAP